MTTIETRSENVYEQKVHKTIRHPEWCDPRCCDESGTSDIHHESAPEAWQASVDDRTAYVGLCRHDVVGWEVDHPQEEGDTHTLLHLVDTGSVNLDGSPRDLDVALTADEARCLAGDLIKAAAAAERATRRKSVRPARPAA